MTPQEIYELKSGTILKSMGIQWIPVEERLPDNSDHMVLVQISGRPACNIGLENALCIAQYYPDEGWILEEYPFWDDAHPVAWMPLPEPYKKE